MNTADEQRARDLLHAAVREPRLSPDPYGRLMRRVRHRQRARVTALSGLAVAGVATAAVLPTQLLGHHTASGPVSPLGGGSTGPVQPTQTNTTATATTVPPSPSVQSVSPSPTAQVIATQTDAVRHFMESDSSFANATVPGTSGRVYCGVTIVGQSSDGQALYAYFTCQKFSNNADALEPGTGMSAPVLLHVQGTGPQTQVLSWQLPSEGSQYAPSIEQMFPPSVAAKMLQPPAGLVPAAAALRTRAQADLDNGQL